jgi:hypothetical protein
MLSSKPGRLQLGHMTALHTMHVVDMGIYSRLARGDQLPPNLEQLSWDWRYRGQLLTDDAPPGSMQPLLALTGLQRLRLAFSRALASESLDVSYSLQLAELVELPRLQELALHYNCVPLPSVAAAASAWAVLPLVELSLSHDAVDSGRRIPAALVQQLGQLHGLTHLALHGKYVHAPLADLAAVLRQLPALQHLALGLEPSPWHFCGSGKEIRQATHGVAAATELLHALDELRKLHTIHVSVPLKLIGCATDDAAKQLAQPLEQVLGNQLSGHCSVRVWSVDRAELNIRIC